MGGGGISPIANGVREGVQCGGSRRVESGGISRIVKGMSSYGMRESPEMMIVLCWTCVVAVDNKVEFKPQSHQ